MTTQNDEIEQLFRKSYPSALKLALAIVHDREIARDIVHDVFAKLLTAPRTDVTESYLIRSVRNSCVDYLRGMSVRERINNLMLIEGDEIESEEWPDEDTFRLIARSMEQLPSEQCRRVVDMRYRLGLKYRDIANALNISEVAVYRHLRHALDLLRKTLRNK